MPAAPLGLRTIRDGLINQLLDGGSFDAATHAHGHVIDDVKPLVGGDKLLLLFENGQVFEVTVKERKDD